MPENEQQHSFEEAARLLVELQDQLKEYRSVLDTLNDLAARSESVDQSAGHLAEATKNLAPMVNALQQTRESLKTSLELTFQTLNHSQEKAREYQEGFEKVGEEFAKNMEEVSRSLEQSLNEQLVQKTSEIGSDLDQLFKKPEGIISQNFQWLKYLGIANLVLLSVLLLSFWLSSPSSPTETSSSLPAENNMANTPTPTNSSVPSQVEQRNNGSSLNVQILNGCGVSGIAARFESFLESNGFAVMDTDNANHFDYTTTRIETKPGSKLAGERIAESLRLSPLRVNDFLTSQSTYDVVIILGKDYRRLNPYLQN